MLEQNSHDLGSPGRVLGLKYFKNAQNYLELCLLSILIFFQVIFMPISSHLLSQVPLMNTSGILMPRVGRPNVIFICNELLVFCIVQM